jgi:hypothetical protein
MSIMIAGKRERQRQRVGRVGREAASTAGERGGE